MGLSMEQIKEGTTFETYHKLTGTSKFKYLKMLEKESCDCAGWHLIKSFKSGNVFKVENEWFRQRKWAVL